MNTLRQSIILFLLTFLCISTPPVWAQKPAQSSAPAVHYTYKVIAKKTAKQDCIFDGRKVTHLDDAYLASFIFTANGTIIFWAYTDEGHTLCKNSQALAYNGKSMSGSTLFNEVNDNVGMMGNSHDPEIFAYNASGDVIYGVWTKTGNSENYAVALNDALVVNPQAHSEASGQIIFGMDGHALSPRFTKDGKYAVPVLVKDVSDINKNSPKKSKWLVGGTLQDTVPDPDRSASDALRLDHPVGIYADELFKRFLGSNPIIPHADIFEYQYFISKCRCNRKGQIAMLLSGNSSQVILVATPTNAPGPEPPPCLHYQEMQAEAKELKKLADTLETNDQAYQEAVIDMLLQGYGSDYARLGLAVDEDEIPALFADEVSIQTARKSIVASVRAKAAAMADIANTGITSDYDPPGHYTSEASIKYFCSRDPAQLSEDAWEGLYQAGYIDYPTYKRIYWKNFVDDSFDTAIETVITAATWELTVPRLFARIPFKFAMPATRIGLFEAETLKGVVKRSLRLVKPKSLGNLYSSETAETVNAAALKDFVAGGGDPSKWITEWEPGTTVRDIITTEPRVVTRVFTRGKSSLKSRWVTLEDVKDLTAEEIMKRYSLPYKPTDVVSLLVPKGTKMRMGWALSGGKQVKLELLDMVNFEKIGVPHSIQ